MEKQKSDFKKIKKLSEQLLKEVKLLGDKPSLFLAITNKNDVVNIIHGSDYNLIDLMCNTLDNDEQVFEIVARATEIILKSKLNK